MNQSEHIPGGIHKGLGGIQTGLEQILVDIHAGLELTGTFLNEI